jgi:transcriptional regulator with XRE-family HTH domain
MDTVKLNVRAIAANEKMSIEKLAEKCDIDPSHLKSVSSGRTVMTARDLIQLALNTGISPYNIQY